MSARGVLKPKNTLNRPEEVGLKGEPQVKRSTRHTEIHTGKERTWYKL
jgi:hypothetical protein